MGKAKGDILHPKEFKAWENMKLRCYSPNATGYNLYGGRGIKVATAWYNSFTVFLHDMGKAPSPRHSLDRIDVNGNYGPGNCRWATTKEQMRNTRRNKRIDGVSLQDKAEELGIHPATLNGRLKSGKNITDPVRKPYGLSEASRKYGIPISTLRNRMVRNGLTLEEAVNNVKKK